MSTIQFEIKKQIATLSSSSKGWSKELNLISWNGYPPKYDIRDWNASHTKMGKGVTLSESELKELYYALKQLFEGSQSEELNPQRYNWQEQVNGWLEHSPLFIQQIKNVLMFMKEKGYSVEKQRELLIGAQSAASEEALQYEMESISSIYSPLYSEFIDLVQKLELETLEQFFNMIENM
ncbi:hypothetical protein ETC01_16815 [Geobacillus sp. NFOSA3]|uniref:Transcriptional coactivator p15 (PC4) C-terminal domain-containing protein n=1 Tax=Parageobacillus toebii TaxID=153151 RepID=A0A150M8K1_9BACL|nr:hypothetical protein B4110_3894 [Parageobacillus toebii]NNU94771.1 hypothetical protein [Geobacillus sp. NFOSA3]PDM38956.1 hypothetical protein CN643_16375 [Parageobacillus yumthangensis]PUF89321.1 hypothetical protein DCC82_10050 [Geobacillus sp. LYN3]TXK87260.1 hypothetical protein FVE68_10495 [Geobacillus sp. AYS3]TXK90614.1 hypothetical protein FVE24_10630 [Parageobacillus sp. SY1]